LDLLIGEVAKLREATAEIVSLVGRVNVIETKMSAQDSVIASLVQEVKMLKEHVNEREQYDKLTAVRIFNVPGSDSETGLAVNIYDTILKPILAAAKQKGDLATLPQVGTTIVEVYRAGKFAQGSNKPPPPVIVKFTNSVIRMAILRNKRNNTPPPSEVGAKRIIIVEDLTPATHRKLRDLLEDDRVEKAWTISGHIWYVSKKSKTPVKVKSIYDTTNAILG